MSQRQYIDREEGSRQNFDEYQSLFIGQAEKSCQELNPA